MLFCASADKLLGNCTNENHHVFKADSVKYFDYIFESSAFNAEAPKTRLFYHLKKVNSYANFAYYSNHSVWGKAKKKNHEFFVTTLP